MLITKPFIPNGWELVSNCDNKADWSIFQTIGIVEYISKIQISGGKISGYELLHEVKNLKPLSSCFLDLLLERKNNIPQFIIEMCPLFFFGTIYRDVSGNECVRCLCENEGKVYWRWRWLKDFWRCNNPVLVVKKTICGFAE